MSGDPDARYPTARAMREDLERYASRSNMELPVARELSDLVSSLFAQEHQRQRALIEERLSALDDPDGYEPSLGALPQFVLTPIPPPISLVQTITAPPIAAPPAPVPTRSSIRFGMAIAVGAILAAGSVVLLTASQFRPPTTFEVPLSAPARAPFADPVQVASVQVAPVQPPPAQAPLVEAPVEATPVQAIAAQVAPARADRPAARIYPPPPPRSHPSLVVASAAPPPKGDEPSTRAPSLPISAIDVPAARPVREIRKENPYLQ
jgi:hypothetical protein